MRIAFLPVGLLLLSGGVAMGQTMTAPKTAGPGARAAATGQGLVLDARNDPSLLPRPAREADRNGVPGAQPIPTQWPTAKLELIPTRWPKLKVELVDAPQGRAKPVPGQTAGTAAAPK